VFSRLAVVLLTYFKNNRVRERNEEEEQGKASQRKIINENRELSEYYKEEFPFLLYYSGFKKEYERLAGPQKIAKYFQLEILRMITEELWYQVIAANINFLKYKITKRYSEEITNHFTTSLRLGLINNENLIGLTYAKLKEYKESQHSKRIFRTAVFVNRRRA
jgi:hypothetical protein